MRILVFGNINAGKSYVVDVLRNIYPSLPVISIDDYRKRYGDVSFEGDEEAMAAFITDASSSESSIVECTGLGPLGIQLQKALRPKSSVIIHVRASLSTCQERITQKDFSATPYPPFSETLEDTISRCHSEFERGDLEALWKSTALWDFSIDGESNKTEKLILGLPLVQLKALSAVTGVLAEMNQTKALIWYGSGPRGELVPESDIDLFLQTSQEITVVENFLRSNLMELAFTDLLKSKLVLRFNSRVMVEITCADDLLPLDHFYSYSRIKDSSLSVLLGDEQVLNHLDQIEAAGNDNTEDVQFLLSEAFYYLCSLNPLASKGDRYKFYFHANIFLHNIVRLKAMDVGQTETNYLPVDAMEVLNSKEKQQLFFRVQQDMTEFIAGAKDCLIQFLRTSETCRPFSEKYLKFLEAS